MHYPTPWSLLHLWWSTGWNQKWLNESTMKDWSDDPSHHQQTLLPQEPHIAPDEDNNTDNNKRVPIPQTTVTRNAEPGWARPAGYRSRWWRSASVWSGWSCSAWSDWSSLRRPSRSPATAGQRPAAAGLEPPPTCLQTEWRPARLWERKKKRSLQMWAQQFKGDMQNLIYCFYPNKL